MNIEIVGYLATIIISLSLTPQLIKSWRTKSTKDISIIWTCIYLFGLILWLTYGIGISSYPLIASSSIEATMALCLLGIKLKFK
jgi:MtN3 and saliva related transmembrane protein